MDIRQSIVIINIQSLIKMSNKEKLLMLETCKQQWIIYLMDIHKELFQAVRHAKEQDILIQR